jgi:hypothetical protein
MYSEDTLASSSSSDLASSGLVVMNCASYRMLLEVEYRRSTILFHQRPFTHTVCTKYFTRYLLATIHLSLSNPPNRAASQMPTEEQHTKTTACIRILFVQYICSSNLDHYKHSASCQHGRSSGQQLPAKSCLD